MIVEFLVRPRQPQSDGARRNSAGDYLFDDVGLPDRLPRVLGMADPPFRCSGCSTSAAMRPAVLLMTVVIQSRPRDPVDDPSNTNQTSRQTKHALLARFSSSAEWQTPSSLELPVPGGDLSDGSWISRDGDSVLPLLHRHTLELPVNHFRREPRGSHPSKCPIRTIGHKGKPSISDATWRF